MHLVAQLLGLAGHLVAPLTHLFGVVHPTKLFPGRCVVRLCLSHRSTRPDLGIGICGEHGGDPTSVHFFDRAGLDYVSCSPFRVPIACLEAGRSTVTSKAGGRDTR